MTKRRRLLLIVTAALLCVCTIRAFLANDWAWALPLGVGWLLLMCMAALRRS